jgi:predicted RND superfamily exporter protein
MKKNIILFSVAILILAIGCSRSLKDKQNILAKINNYEITQEEFEAEFKESPYGRTNTLESRKEFLGVLINRKLILQDAQLKNLDKDKDFLRMIERFWEQSLLKLALDKKSKEIAGTTVFVSDKEIEETYNKMLSEAKTDRTYNQMYNQIKWEIQEAKELQAIDEWLEGLRKKAHIKINEGLLKADK